MLLYGDFLRLFAHVLSGFRETMFKKQVVLLLSCMCLSFSCTLLSPTPKTDTNNKKCWAPENFTNTSLVGVWESGWDKRKDTLIINNDGTYKQIIHIDNPTFDYESDLLNWSVEISDNGVHYLYLEKMLLCVYWDGISCESIVGTEQKFYDFCQQKWTTITDNGVFIIMGNPLKSNQDENSIRLFSLQKSTETTNVYYLIQKIQP